MVLVRQPTTAGFRPISKYEYIIPGSESVNVIFCDVMDFIQLYKLQSHCLCCK